MSTARGQLGAAVTAVVAAAVLGGNAMAVGAWAAGHTPSRATSQPAALGAPDASPVVHIGSMASTAGGPPAASQAGGQAAASTTARPAAVASQAGAPPVRAGSNVIFDPSNAWAVLAGISTYDSPTHPTYGGDGDVSAFHRLLIQSGWQDSHILILTDQAATANAIRSAMQWLVSNSGPATFSLFHYSGHVLLKSGHTWMWGVDNNFISEDEFGSDLRGLAGHAWIDVAGCESAAFDKGLSSSQRFFTASSMANQKSYEEPSWGESVWTGLTVDQGMLQHRAGSGAISVQQAVRWAQNQAAQYTSSQQPYGPQNPYAVGGDGEWYLGPTGAPAAPPAGNPPSNNPPPGNPPGNSPPPQNGCTRVGSIAVKCNG